MNRKELIELFPVKKKHLYFNFAADGPLPVPAKAAVMEALEEKVEMGMIAVPKQVAVYENLRDELSILFKSGRENFAFTKNTSEGVLLALLAMDINADENYIAAGDAFPTTVKMMANNCRGEMRRVTVNDPTPIREQLLRVIDGKTRAIVLDWVHYFTGKVVDIEAVVEVAKERNIFTVIDGIQGAGALRLDLDAAGIDFFVSGGHKWLLSLQGAAFTYVSDRVWERLNRRSFGWLGYDWGDFTDFSMEAGLRDGAAVMEYGTRSYTAALSLVETLRVVNAMGIDTVERRNRELKELFIAKISAKGYEIIQNERSSSIVAFRSPSENIVLLKKKLEANNVIVSLRNGYIRAAFHLVNDKGEVEKFIELL